MKNNHLDNMVKETYQYFYIDGLVELAVGLLFTLIGLSLLGWVYTPAGSIWRIVSVLLLPLLVLGGTFGMKYGVQLFKERITYQRTGYVRYKQGEPSLGRWLVPLIAFAAVIVLWVVPEQLSRMSSIQGFLLALILGLIGYRVSLNRFFAVAAVAMVVGVAASYLFTNELIGSMVTYVIVGGLMVLVGGATLINYLRQHPAAGSDPEGLA